MNYNTIYQKRLNRFGTDYQERIQGSREKLFDNYLAKSSCKIEFTYGGYEYLGSFERDQQTASKDLHYLLTQVDVDMPGGTLLTLEDSDGTSNKWMVFWKEDIQASGYNKYVMLRMSHSFNCYDPKTKVYVTGYGYLWGPQDAVIQEEVMKAGRRFVYTAENEKRYLILPRNLSYKVEDYVIIADGDFSSYYRITGYDYQSVNGVEYITLDPIFQYNLIADPTPPSTGNLDDYYWMTGGNR